MQKITTIGLDIAKSVFQFHSVDADGRCCRSRTPVRRGANGPQHQLQTCEPSRPFRRQRFLPNFHWKRRIVRPLDQRTVIHGHVFCPNIERANALHDAAMPLPQYEITR